MAIRDILHEPGVTPALPRLTIDDRLSEQEFLLAQSADGNGAVAREQWAEALAIYRDATEAFRRAIGIRRRVLSAPPADRETGDRAPAVRPRSDAGVLTRTHPHLSPREREVTELVAQGLSNRAIAKELVIEQGRVANHVAHILSKCGVSNRTQVATLVLSSPAESPQSGQ